MKRQHHLSASGAAPGNVQFIYITRWRYRQAAALRLFQSNAIRLSFADATLESIGLTLVFNAIPDEVEALCEMHRVLCPLGVVMLIDACVPSGGNIVARGLGRLWALFGDQLGDEVA